MLWQVAVLAIVGAIVVVYAASVAVWCWIVALFRGGE